MILFQLVKDTQKHAIIFSGRLQVNICAKISWSPEIPLTVELGLGLFTISLEIWKISD
jgi:hypothetical protein